MEFYLKSLTEMYDMVLIQCLVFGSSVPTHGNRFLGMKQFIAIGGGMLLVM